MIKEIEIIIIIQTLQGKHEFKPRLISHLQKTQKTTKL